MKNLFIIYTPYQLLAALNICAQIKNSENTFLFVNKNLGNYRQLCENINNVKIQISDRFFKNEKSVSIFHAHVNIVGNLFCFKKAAKQLFKNEVYDNLYVPSDDIVSRVIYFRLKRNGLQTLNLFDDGLGTYDLHTFKKVSLVGRIIYKLFLDHNYADSIRRIYCYRPDLMAISNFNITLIPICQNEMVMNWLKSQSKGKLTPYNHKKVIFFDQGLQRLSGIQKSLNCVKKIYSDDEVLVKMHPRVIEENYEGFQMSKDGLPFESIAAASSLNESLLIAHSSGACVTPFLMFNQSPKIVLLFKITKEFHMQQGAMEYFEKINELGGGNLIFMPNTIEELEVYLEENIGLRGIELL